MTRLRIIINLLLAYFFMPLFIVVQDYIKIDILHDESVYHGSYYSYITTNVNMTVLFMPTAFLVLILLPYNLIAIRPWYGKKISLLMKVLTFQLVIVIMFSLAGTFVNVWYYPYWKNI